MGIHGPKFARFRLILVSKLICVSLLSVSATSRAEESADELDFSDYAKLDLESLLEIQVVESASRREQSQLDAAASMTVITADQIEASGVIHIPELLRRVPSLHVIQGSANAYTVGIRGISRLVNNRVLVLVDGRPVNDRLSGLQLWNRLPIQAGDIERIEIIRGPGSTFYGADALSGVINIRSKRPLDHAGLEASAFGSVGYISEQPDSSGTGPAILSGGAGRLAYNWVNQSKTLGLRFNLQGNHQPEGPFTQGNYINGPFAYGTQAALEYRPDGDLTLFSSLSHSFFEGLTGFGNNGSPPSIRYSEQALTVHLEKKHLIWEPLNLQFHIDGRRVVGKSLNPDNLQDLDPGTTLAGWEAHSMLLLDLELFDGHNVTTFGGEATLFVVTDFFSQPWYAFYALILNNETRFFADKSLILNLGARIEQIVVQEDEFGEVTYRNFSPRAALSWRVAKDHSLRLVGASAFRTPTPWEAFTNLEAQLVEPPTPPNRFTAGNPGLKPEQLYSVELGYLGLPTESLRLDAALFYQRVDGLIGDVEKNVLPATLTNAQSLDQAGIELAINYTPADWLSTHLNYTFIYSRDAETGERLKEWPQHLYSLGAELRLPWRMRLAVDAYMVFDYRPRTSYFVNQGSTNQFRQWENRQAADHANVNLRLGRFFMDDNRAEIFLSLRNLVGFIREPEGLRSFPDEVVQPIGGAILMGLRVRGI